MAVPLATVPRMVARKSVAWVPEPEKSSSTQVRVWWSAETLEPLAQPSTAFGHSAMGVPSACFGRVRVMRAFFVPPE